MEEAPVAPAEAPASEATPTTNQAPEAQPAPAPATPTADIPADQIEAFNKFVNANGGFEKAFAKLKTDVSTPAPAPAPEPAKTEQPAQPAQPVQKQEFKMPAGYRTFQEEQIQGHFERLASMPEYKPIADELISGKLVEEMAKFGIYPTVVAENGERVINSGRIRDFLDLYVKTVPAQAPTAPVTSTPTVDYVNVGEQVTNRDDAMRILEQNRKLKPGIAPHPQTEAAKEFLKGYFNGTKK